MRSVEKKDPSLHGENGCVDNIHADILYDLDEGLSDDERAKIVSAIGKGTKVASDM